MQLRDYMYNGNAVFLRLQDALEHIWVMVAVHVDALEHAWPMVAVHADALEHAWAMVGVHVDALEHAWAMVAVHVDAVHGHNGDAVLLRFPHACPPAHLWNHMHRKIHHLTVYIVLCRLLPLLLKSGSVVCDKGNADGTSVIWFYSRMQQRRSAAGYFPAHL
jgi:hypothetical protein